MDNNKMNLQGKVALVTGGSKGIGRAIASRLASEGASVAVNYGHDETSADETVREIISSGGKAVKYRARVEDWGEVREMILYVRQQLGEIDLLVNNAGIAKDAPLVYMEPDDFRKVIEVNLMGCFNCTKAVSLSMIKRKRGCIVNISSLSGVIGVPGQSNYSASKGGIISFTKSVAREMAFFGIRVNAVAPGFIETSMTEKIDNKYRDKVISMIPAGRFGQSGEVANTVVFLGSDLSRYITGQTLIVDGGLSISI